MWQTGNLLPPRDGEERDIDERPRDGDELPARMLGVADPRSWLANLTL